MKLFAQFSRLFASAFVALLLAACGGGGNSDSTVSSSAVTPTTSSTSYTAENAGQVAGAGLYYSELAFNNVITEVSFAGDFMKSFLDSHTTTFGNQTISLACAQTISGTLTGGGTLTVAITRGLNGASVGFGYGDAINLEFDMCDFGDGYVYRGSELVRVSSSSASMPSNLTLSYSIQDTNREYSKTGKIVSQGELSVTYIASGNSVKVNTSSGGNYYTQYYKSKADTAAIFTMVQPFSLNMATEISGSMFSHKIDGSLIFPTSTGYPSFLYATTIPLTGTLVSGSMAPSSGVVNIEAREQGISLKTQTTISGNGNALVKGDSDKNGTLDLTLDTTYSALTQ